MAFFAFAAGVLGDLVLSLAGNFLSDEIKEARLERRMKRLVDEAVDRIVERMEEYLTKEKLSEAKQQLLLTALRTKLEPLVQDPQRFFAGNLDGATIFAQCHP